MLRGHTMGDNRARFGDLAENMIAQARRPRAPSTDAVNLRIRPSRFSQLNANSGRNSRILTIKCQATGARFTGEG